LSKRPPRFWLAIAALIATAALWSLNGPLIKLLNQSAADERGLSGLSISAYRSLLAGLLFLPLAWPRRRTLKHAHPAWPIASVATFTLMTVSFVIATTQTAAASAIALQYTSPVVVFALSPLLLHARPRWSEGAVLLLAMAGVGVIFFGHPAGEMPVLVVALMSGLGYGMLTVMLRGLESRSVSLFVVVVLNALGSGVVLLLALGIAHAAGRDTLLLTWRQFGLLALMSIVQFIGPYALFSWSLRHVEAHRASLIVLLEMILNPLWTWLLVGEFPPAPTLIGGSLILAGVAANVLVTWRHAAARRLPRGLPHLT
jgi:drug/metabolite transporter (DMT)-like permease